MAKKRKHHKPAHSGSKPEQNKTDKASAFEILLTKDPSVREICENYNRTDPRERESFLKQMGLTIHNADELGIMTKSHFVIPGYTRFECTKCGECCRTARKISTLNYEPCPYLDPENLCTKHDDRYNVCKWFPFWIFRDDNLGLILTIKPFCSGYMKGGLVDYGATVKKLLNLQASFRGESDGATVIHEVIYLPTKHRWVFPTRENIDELMEYLRKNDIHRNEEVEDRIRKTENRAELEHAHTYTSGLLGKITDPHLTVDESGIISDVNESFCTLSGKTRSGLMGTKLSLLFEDQANVDADISKCFLKNKITSSPHKMLCGRETPVPVILNALVYRSRTDGLVHGALVSIKEVDHTLFRELIQTQHYARRLLEASPDYFVVIDKDGIITDVNEAAIKATGYTREELSNSDFSLYFTDPARAKQGIALTIGNGQVRDFEMDLLTKSGSAKPVSFNANVFYDVDGSFQGIFASARDISDLRKMIRRLTEAQNYARGLIECSPDLMVTINRNGIITDVNEAAVNLTGQEKYQLIGSYFKDYFDEKERAETGINRTFSEGKVIDYRLNIINSSGTIIPVTFNASIYRDTQGVTQGIFAVARECRP
ncbi:MAG: PAS domain S-box protein [Firmicutes bacterium]|nr:PAS domain S-box protein [Bacillota bacterium]